MSIKIIFLCFKVFTIEKIDLNKFIVDTLSDLFSVIGYLIYIEIVELKFCNLDYNIRKNIMIRSRIEFTSLDSEYGIAEEDDFSIDNTNDNDNDNKPLTDLDVYN